MATLFIQRATPFKRGAQSIQILVDGKRACTLWNNDPKTVEVEVGQHTLQADMGGLVGKPITVTAQSDEIRKIRLFPGEFKMENTGLFVASMTIWCTPGNNMNSPFFWVKIALDVAVVSYFVYKMRKFKKSIKGNLLLTDEGPISAEELPKNSRKQKV